CRRTSVAAFSFSSWVWESGPPRYVSWHRQYCPLESSLLRPIRFHASRCQPYASPESVYFAFGKIQPSRPHSLMAYPQYFLTCQMLNHSHHYIDLYLRLQPELGAICRKCSACGTPTSDDR